MDLLYVNILVENEVPTPVFQLLPAFYIYRSLQHILSYLLLSVLKSVGASMLCIVYNRIVIHKQQKCEKSELC